MTHPFSQSPLITVLLGIVLLLALATIITVLLNFLKRETDFRELNLRIRSWWVIIGLFSMALLLNKPGVILFFAGISFLSLREYLKLVPLRKADQSLFFWLYAAIPVQYWWIYQAWYGMFIVFIPVYLFLFLPFRLMLTGDSDGFLKSAAVIHWGVMITIFNLSHSAFMMVLPPLTDQAVTGASIVLFHVFTTQFNDVAQYVWGKILGRHPVTPRISPNKTWEGLVGGLITTVLLSYWLAPWLTPLRGPEALGAGFIVGLGGFIGDVVMSALKRDMRVKDSSQLIPGHGGILDRVDSMAYSAPLFFHYVYYLKF